MPWYFYSKGGVLVTPIPFGSVPTGAIVYSPIPYPALPQPELTAPEGFLFCNGDSVSKDFMATINFIPLFNVIQDLFGPPALNTFVLPDFRGKMPRGIVLAAGGIGYLAGAGGSKTHTHTLTAHTHPTPASHVHSMDASHLHTINNHHHGTASHVHGTNTLNTDLTTQLYNGPVGDRPDTWEPPAVHNPTALATVEPHNHGIYGSTDDSSSHQNAHGTGTGNSSDSGGASDTGSATAAFGTISPTTSGSGGAVVSDPVVQFPPFFTGSFLIKT